MITLSLSPVRCEKAAPVVVADGDTIWVDGQPFDFTQLPEGAALPAVAVQSDWFLGSVERINGDLHIRLLLPHGPDPSPAVAFPEPIKVTKAGAVKLPRDEAPSTPEYVAPQEPEENGDD